MRLREWHKNLLLVVGSCAVTLLAAEAVLRLAWRPDEEHTVIEAHPVYGWALRPNSAMHSRASDRGLDYHIAIDSLGLRDRERTHRPAAGVRRVLFLGDSMVFGAGVEAADRCTDRLEKALGPDVEVVNAGVSGWGIDQEYLYLLHAGFALHPDVVVLGICMLNDVLNDMLPHELFGTAPKPRFVLADGQLALLAAPPRPPAADTWAVVLKHSRLLHFVGRHARLLEARRHAHPAAASATGAPYYPEDLEADSSHWAVFRVPYTPRFEAAFAVSEKLLAAMRDSCAARGVPLVWFAWPQKVEVDARDRALELEHYGYDPKQFDLTAPYRRLRADADSLGVPLVYPVDAFAAAAQSQQLFFARDGHPNAAGHALAATVLQPILRDVLESFDPATHAQRP